MVDLILLRQINTVGTLLFEVEHFWNHRAIGCDHCAHTRLLKQIATAQLFSYNVGNARGPFLYTVSVKKALFFIKKFTLIYKIHKAEGLNRVETIV